MERAKGTAALEKAFDLLEAIGLSAEGLEPQQLNAQVNLPRATLYRLLGLLIDRGMIRRDTHGKRYRLGFRYLEMVRGAWMEPDLVAAASFELRSLRDLTGETTYLAIRDGEHVLSLERCDGAHSNRSAAAMGQRKPMHCTGQGKAILSAMAEGERRDLLKQIQLQALTPLTITDRARLLTELEVTRTRGYAIDDEEIVMGIRCVAAPIIDASGQVKGALSIAGPAYRLTRKRLDLLGPEVAASAQRVGSQLTVRHVSNGPEALQPIDDRWAFLGGFPRWSCRENCLYWVDRLAPAVYRYTAEVQRKFFALNILSSAWSSPPMASSLRWNMSICSSARGGYAIAVNGGSASRHASAAIHRGGFGRPFVWAAANGKWVRCTVTEHWPATGNSTKPSPHCHGTRNVLSSLPWQPNPARYSGLTPLVRFAALPHFPRARVY